MNRLYTEIRISHKNLEEKQEYERKLDQALKDAGYKNRNEFFKEKIREAINHQELNIGDMVINKCTGKIYEIVQINNNIIVGQNEHERRAFGNDLTYRIGDLELINK